MKAFRFRLESLLHLRSLTREKSLKEYAHAINERRLQEERRERISQRLAQIEDSVADRRKESISGHEQANFLASIEHDKDTLTNQREITSRALAEEEGRKAAYLKADIAEKALLRLKERRKEEHLQVEEAKDERALEDVIGARYRYISPIDICYEIA